MTLSLEIKDLKVSYGQQTVIQSCHLSLNKGEILSLLGASGCGKSTILRAIAGLKSIDAGTIRIAGQIVDEAGYCLPTQKRPVGMIFQDYALFPHMTVNENICFGLEHLDKTTQTQLARESLAMVRLEHFSDRYPHELSGGQQQRVAIARALVRKPHLLLLDEPFSNLDQSVKEELMSEMRQIFKQSQMSAIMVTHHKAEAMFLSDRIAVMGQGNIQQIDTVMAIYDFPQNNAISTMLGHTTLLKAKKNHHGYETALGPLKTLEGLHYEHQEADIILHLRPHQISLNTDTMPHNAVVKSFIFMGDYCIYDLLLTSGEIISVMAFKRYHPGQSLHLQIDL
ncbi:ABC transporter ATP-binding protein [Basilea psittacipulmonis]|uniref:ABC transporter domain-containing protein n=1 Tax=Basilea psittacipulmonis DSM 24701 TaxID=1072685 RepID=A0A077DEK3_9BURK|nr:ABC transporter ATP-binding protein [Basilea psittacipulmonis]AIL32596.1 hypothetical protein IX83_04090 [Basilea psittacipulmonis DSM 24701]